MKTDTYTKVVLTGIAIFLGVIAFDYKPTINAQASSSSGVEMISAGQTGVWHFKDGKVRGCFKNYENNAVCGKWSD